MTKSIFVFATLAVTLFSCKKEKEEEVVTATITFNTPSANDTIPFGAAVHLTGTVSGSAEMHGYTVTFTNLTTGSDVFAEIHEVHAANYALDYSWTNNVADTSVLKLVVDVEKDHDGNMEMKELTIVCLPQ
jgi:hypothetical protein